MTCGQPAVYFGALSIVRGDFGFRPARHLSKTPFCAGCTRDRGWHRQFVSDRRALPGEVCQAPILEALP